MVKALLLDKKNQNQAPIPVKAVEESCVTCSGTHSYRNCPATDGNIYRDNIQEYVSQAATANFNQGNTGYRALIANQIRPPGITTRSGVAYQGPTIPTTSSSPPKVLERETKPVVAPVSALMPNPKPSIPYPSRRNDERRREKANDQIEKFYEIFKDLSFKISLTDALILMPKFASTLKALIGNKEKLSEMDRTPRSFLKTGRALIDVYEGELTLRVGKEAITFNLDQTSRYSSNYDDNSVNRIDVIDMV
ncbi:hypothetical protein Tco_0816892 [Tanacetum coccineum]